MTQPLALLLYDKLLPGSQLINRLQDLGYRVRTIHDPSLLHTCAEQEKPIIVLADLDSSRGDVCEAIARLRAGPETRHLPVIAFGDDTKAGLHTAARQTGATIVVSKSGLLDQLEVLLDQALNVE